MNSDGKTRRAILLFGGAAVVSSSIAGCLDEGAPDTTEGTNEPNGHEEDADERDPELEINGRFLSSAFPIEFVEPDFEGTTGFAGDARLAYVHWHDDGYSHWHQSPVEIDAGETRSGRTRFLEEGAEEIPLGPEETFTQDVYPAEETAEGLLATEIDGGIVDLSAEGESGNEGELVFELLADGERRWRSPPLPVEIR